MKEMETGSYREGSHTLGEVVKAAAADKEPLDVVLQEGNDVVVPDDGGDLDKFVVGNLFSSSSKLLHALHWLELGPHVIPGNPGTWPSDLLENSTLCAKFQFSSVAIPANDSMPGDATCSRQGARPHREY